MRNALYLIAALVFAAGAAVAQNALLPVQGSIFNPGEVVIAKTRAGLGGLSHGSANQVLTSQGNGQPPVWASIGANGTYQVAMTPAQVAAATCAEQALTVTGADTADTFMVNPPTATTNAQVVAVRVSAANVLALTFCNPSGGIIKPTVGTYRFLAIRS
jgi:hypothetical protein